MSWDEIKVSKLKELWGKGNTASQIAEIIGGISRNAVIGKKRLLLPFPLPLAEFSARFFEMLPNPLLTRDQLKLLKYDNIQSGKYKTNSEIGVPSIRFFDQEVKKYCYMWREGGQFSTEKYKQEELEKKVN